MTDGEGEVAPTWRHGGIHTGRHRKATRAARIETGADPTAQIGRAAGKAAAGCLAQPAAARGGGDSAGRPPATAARHEQAREAAAVFRERETAADGRRDLREIMELLGEGRELRRDEKRWSEGEETMELTDGGEKRRSEAVKVVAARVWWWNGGAGGGGGKWSGGRDAAWRGEAGGASGEVQCRREWWWRAVEAHWRAAEAGNDAGSTREREGSSGEWGKREMEVWGSFYSARGVETMAGRGGNSRRGGVATWARGGGKPAPKFGGKVGEGVEEVVGMRFHHLGANRGDGVTRNRRRPGAAWRRLGGARR
uniref:Uncharacterized protein n=1 Tax=Oryza sativa subsp. japonica TaxID=39947 RepID=Q6H479_ORYSJ|nr:hypothetical protein [Oryza sativa Japonica Group]BAD26470.1 hypothetical protein [Oryza sativa Japonica Group]